MSWQYVSLVGKDEKKCWNCDNFIRSGYGSSGRCILSNDDDGKKRRNDSECKKFIKKYEEE